MAQNSCETAFTWMMIPLSNCLVNMVRTGLSSAALVRVQPTMVISQLYTQVLNNLIYLSAVAISAQDKSMMPPEQHGVAYTNGASKDHQGLTIRQQRCHGFPSSFFEGESCTWLLHLASRTVAASWQRDGIGLGKSVAEAKSQG